MAISEKTTRVKVCGLRRPQDARLAVELGAWALGVIFAPESPRRVELEEARAVLDAAAPGIEKVGVFVNAPFQEVSTAVAVCGLTAVQLHGDESPEACRELRQRLGCKVIKALRVSGTDSLQPVVRFDTDYLLLDTYHPGIRGGTGRIFDWELAAGLPGELRGSRVILSGGLKPENVETAIAAVSPFAVDVCSGIESKPGVKDKDRMEQFFINAGGQEENRR